MLKRHLGIDLEETEKRRPKLTGIEIGDELQWGWLWYHNRGITILKEILLDIGSIEPVEAENQGKVP
jgi:hypothetical protein